MDNPRQTADINQVVDKESGKEVGFLSFDSKWDANSMLLLTR